MIFLPTAKTSWFRLSIIIFLTLLSFYVIKESFARTLIEWQEVNEIRLAEIENIGQ